MGEIVYYIETDHLYDIDENFYAFPATYFDHYDIILALESISGWQTSSSYIICSE